MIRIFFILSLLVFLPACSDDASSAKMDGNYEQEQCYSPMSRQKTNYLKS
jgi:hypothetical protein